MVGHASLLGGVGLGRADDDDPVGEGERQLRPSGVGAVELEDEVVVAGLGLVHVLQERRLGDGEPGLDEAVAPERGVDAASARGAVSTRDGRSRWPAESRRFRVSSGTVTATAIDRARSVCA